MKKIKLTIAAVLAAVSLLSCLGVTAQAVPLNNNISVESGEEQEDIFTVNKKNIEKNINQSMKKLSSNYKLKEIDTGKYSNININGISFNIKQYDIEGVGNLLVMDSKDSSMLQMLTFVITPYYKSLPLLSIDYMYMQDKRSCIIDNYDLVPEKDSSYTSYMNKFMKIKDEYSYLTDMTLKESWYDSLRTVYTAKNADASNDLEISNMFMDNLKMFMKMEKKSPLLKEEEQNIKINITQDYVDKLVENGGVSTNLFISALGKDETKDFFNKVFFGTDNYR